MDKLRTGIEGYELPQNSNTLIDDINLVITNYASNYFYYFWIDSHHITQGDTKMGRLYTALECGCLISCNGGGGLMPCDTDGCVASEYIEQHKPCEYCGECMTCNPYHCLMGVINHSCEWWDLCVDGLDGIKNRIARIEYCPWCGEKLELKGGDK